MVAVALPSMLTVQGPTGLSEGQAKRVFYLYLLWCWGSNPGPRAHKPRALPMRCLTGQEQHGNAEESERESWTPKTVQPPKPLTFFSPPFPRPGEMEPVCVRCVGWG